MACNLKIQYQVLIGFSQNIHDRSGLVSVKIILFEHLCHKLKHLNV